MRLPCQQAGLPQSSMWDFSSIVSGCGCRSSDARRCWKCLSRILFFFFYYYYYSFFRLFSFPLFFLFFSISFVFASFSDFPRSFLFPFLSFLFSFFFLSIYLSIHPSIHPPDNGQFSAPQKRRIRERSNNIYSPPSFEETYEIFPSAASSACLLSLRNDTLSPFFFNIFLFFCNSSSIVPRDRESLLKFKIACKYFQISSSFKIFRKEKRRKGSWSRKDREVLFIYFFFRFPLFLETNSRNFLQNPRRSSRERVQTWTKTGGIQETRSLSPNNPTFIIRDFSLGLLLLLSMRIFNIFTFIYLFFFYLEFHITLDFFFFFSLGSTILECSVFVWGSKTAARGW